VCTVRKLLKEINRFPKVVKDASERYEPSAVARFAVDVAQAFNKFYNVYNEITSVLDNQYQAIPLHL